MDFVENHDLLLNRPLTVLKETEVTSCKTVISSRGESAFDFISRSRPKIYHRYLSWSLSVKMQRTKKKRLKTELTVPDKEDCIFYFRSLMPNFVFWPQRWAYVRPTIRPFLVPSLFPASAVCSGLGPNH